MTLDYNSILIYEEEKKGVDLERYFPILNSKFFTQLSNIIGWQSYLKKKVVELNMDVIQKGVVFFALAEVLEKQYSTYENKDLSKQLLVIQAQINKYAKLEAALVKAENSKIFRLPVQLSTTSPMVRQILMALYRIQRLYKKANKKENLTDTHLAQLSAKHSQQSLSKIINTGN